MIELIASQNIGYLFDPLNRLAGHFLQLMPCQLQPVDRCLRRPVLQSVAAGTDTDHRHNTLAT